MVASLCKKKSSPAPQEREHQEEVSRLMETHSDKERALSARVEDLQAELASAHKLHEELVWLRLFFFLFFF